MYGYESWTIKKNECQIIEVFFFFNGAGKDRDLLKPEWMYSPLSYQQSV